jgi:lysophospholipase L1-like esterase
MCKACYLFPAVLFVLGTFPIEARSKQEKPWVGAWSCSPQKVEIQNLPPSPGLLGNILRQVVHLTVNGDELRLRISNEFGDSPLTLESIHIALHQTEDIILPESDRPILFNGKLSVTIPSGAFLYSDPLQFTVQALSDLAVTIKATEVPKDITGHPGSRETSYLAVDGDVSAVSLSNPVKTDHWYLLDGVEVRGTRARSAVVTLGDSITDGRGSTTNGNTRWPDYLARRFVANKKLAQIGVLNQGIGGNRILRDGLGPNALSRFDRDAFGQAAVRWLIVFEGVNDIGGTRAETDPVVQERIVDELIQAYQQFIVRAHTHSIWAYCATITPFGHSFYFNSSAETSRQRINQWVRTSGQCDAVLDFDEAARNPAKPDELDSAFDSGDHLHLNSDGYRKLASSIDLTLFSR